MKNIGEQEESFLDTENATFVLDYLDKQAATAKRAMFAEVDIKILGETGEIIDIIGKIETRNEMKIDELKEELGDLIWYLAQFCREKDAIQYFEVCLTNTLNNPPEKKEVKKYSYRDISRSLYFQVFKLTDGGDTLNFTKTGKPFPALFALSDLESEMLQAILFVIHFIVVLYNLNLKEILTINNEKLFKRHKIKAKEDAEPIAG